MQGRPGEQSRPRAFLCSQACVEGVLQPCHDHLEDKVLPCCLLTPVGIWAGSPRGHLRTRVFLFLFSLVLR